MARKPRKTRRAKSSKLDVLRGPQPPQPPHDPVPLAALMRKKYTAPVRRKPRDDIPCLKPGDTSSPSDMKGIRAEDLILFLTLADLCLQEPGSAFKEFACGLPADRATAFVNKLEREFQKTLMRRVPRGRRADAGLTRRGLLSWEGLLLADICACIEHMWSFFLQSRNAPADCTKFEEVKNAVFRTLDTAIRRDIDRQTYSGIGLPEGKVSRAAKRSRVTRQRASYLARGFDKTLDDLKFANSSGVLKYLGGAAQA